MLYKTSNFWLASLLVSINRGLLKKQKTIIHKSSKFLLQVIKHLQFLGLIAGFCKKNELVYIYLKYDFFGNCVMTQVTLISKPGSKVYTNLFSIKKLCQNNSACIYVFSTNKGLLNNTQALKLKVGGELLFKISL